ncbi:MAG: bifunctional oligoribonuclease/PAP phosphatase NrnA [Candidatus Riflebacteria bacterium]|nr:bifunctional oligoribonuclease/PAP phosphatase NrnA [Candidatus Riflebacteria bacterium]
MPPTDPLSQVIATLHKGQRFFLISHVRPDGDAIGSLAGLARSLRKAGKTVDLGLVDPPPERFGFLLEGETVRKPGDLALDHDAIVILDTGDLPRTGFAEALAKPATVVINIDHHPSNTSFGDINLLDFHASSTCEMVVTLIERARLPFDPDVAQGLYLGLCTDTRFFQNENLRPAAHHAAQRLLETGLEAATIHGRLLSTRKLSEVRILGHALTRLTVELDGRLAWVALSTADLAQQGATMNDVFACGLFNQLTGIDGVVASVGIVENTDGKVYCEFRSRKGFDVKEIAVAMGGGGHLAASGCNREAPLATMVDEALGHLRNRLGSFPR